MQRIERSTARIGPTARNRSYGDRDSTPRCALSRSRGKRRSQGLRGVILEVLAAVDEDPWRSLNPAPLATSHVGLDARQPGLAFEVLAEPLFVEPEQAGITPDFAVAQRGLATQQQVGRRSERSMHVRAVSGHRRLRAW